MICSKCTYLFEHLRYYLKTYQATTNYESILSFMSYPTLFQGFIFGCCIFALGAASSASAQVIPDQTLPINSVVPEDCTTCEITGGTQRDGNLFHSFGTFSIPTDGAARFVHGPSINLIISRVTGDSLSEIDGLISASGSADVFLLNPNGIVFGPNAAIDVGGSFVATSASGMTYTDGTQFVAAPEPTSLLTMTAPVGLQFGIAPGDVVNQSNAGPSQNAIGVPAGLKGAPGETVALIGGDIRLEGGNITVPSGHVELGSVAGNSTVLMQPSASGWSFNYSSASGFQDIILSNVALVDLSDPPLNDVSDAESPDFMANGISGSAHLKGHNIRFNEGAGLYGFNFGSEPGGVFQVDAAELLQLQGARLDLGFASIIITFARGASAAGDIEVKSQNLRLEEGGSIASIPVGNQGGGSGNIHVRVGELIEILGTVQGQTPETRPASSISTQIRGIGDGQTLTVETARLIVRDGGQISSTTFNSGQSGNISIIASEGIQLVGEDPETSSPSGIFTSVDVDGSGDAGNLDIQTAQLEVFDGAQVQSSVRGITGNGGELTVNATEFIRLSGASETADPSQGRSGIFVSVDPATVDSDPDTIDVFPTGDSGNLFVTTPLLVVESGGRISADTFSSGSGGNATLDVDRLRVLNGGEVKAGSLVEENAPSSDRGPGGQLNINASELVEVRGTGAIRDTPITSTLLTEAEGTGPAGNIAIVTPLLTVADGGEITASTVGVGDAGTVNITGDSLEVTNGGRINSTTAGAADGGSIVLTLQDGLSLTGSGSGLFTNTEPDSTGSGGNIIVDPVLIQLNDGAEISVSSQGEGVGGIIDLTADVLSLNNSSRIDAETASSTGGNVTLTTRDFIFLNDNSVISATAGRSQGAGDGGNIDINLAEGFLIATESTNSDIIAQAFEGTGGNIDITARGIFGLAERQALDGNTTNDIDASSQFGESGTITINDPTVDPSKANVELPTDVINAADLVDRRCEADAGQGQSSLILTGRGGLPPNPAQIIRSDTGTASDLEFDETLSDAAVPPANEISQAPDVVPSEPQTQLIEARTWERNEAGHVVLMAARNSSYRVPNTLLPEGCGVN